MDAFYLNPVYERNFPDPFVLKHCGEYWAYCTGTWHDGRRFGVLHSRDLVHWRPLAGALEPLPGDFPCYWAPEVSYDNGHFFMYYSVGNEERMVIRIAMADHPAGPFHDSGQSLTVEPFAIDGHVFVDDNGARYLFYATDFFDRERVGTGTVRDRMLDPLTLAGEPSPITLAAYDWQVYDPRRAEKGGVCWHTVEGPFVLKRKGRYYQMFSGGNWKNITYGVSYAIADSLAAGAEWRQSADGEQVLPILRTLPGRVIGPGHNSVVRGPDNRQLFCVYHRWSQDSSARLLAIDPLDWAGERMLVLGPSSTPQPAPIPPTFTNFFDDDAASLGAGWAYEGGRWIVRDGAAVQEQVDGLALARCWTHTSCFVAEISLRALNTPDAGGGYGIRIDDHLEFLLRPATGQISARVWWGHDGWNEEHLSLPVGFDARTYHLLRVEANLWNIDITLDGTAVRWSTILPGSAGSIALQTSRMAAAFAGFALTSGWEDLFTEASDPIQLGWRAEEQSPRQDNNRPLNRLAKSLRPYGWHLSGQQLWYTGGAGHAFITKDVLLAAYELVVNVYLDARLGDEGCYGLYPAWRTQAPGPLLTVERAGAVWHLRLHRTASEHTIDLPPDFDPTVYQQFRFHKRDGWLAIQWEQHALGQIEVPAGPTQIGLYAYNAVVAFDMVRVTALPD